jgi:hypothetical protein
MAINDLVAYCNHRWRVEHGVAEDLLTAGARRVSARLGGLEFSSRFDAVRLTEAPAVIVGHLARLRSRVARSPAPRASDGPEVHDPAEVVSVDRLCRTLHLLNYLNWRVDEGASLFLDVQARHILSVPNGHGSYFASVIHRCGLVPSQIVLTTSSVFAACPGDYLRRIADGMANYRDRGYRIGLSVTELPLSKPLTNFLCYTAPDYVVLSCGNLDGPRATNPAFVSSQLKRLRGLVEGFGGQLMIEGVDDDPLFQLIRASRVPLVQGSFFERRRRREVGLGATTAGGWGAHV